MQTAFIEHDAFQCGFCTSGEIMSALALLAEADRCAPSHVTPDVIAPPVLRNDKFFRKHRYSTLVIK